MLDSVTITEVCPRDGFQIIKENIPTEEKVNVINRLIDCGFTQIEVTSFVHPKAVPQLSDASEVLKSVRRDADVIFRALIPNLKGLDRAIEAGVHKVKLMLSSTDSHSLHNANAKTLDAMKDFPEIARRCKEAGIKVSGSISVAFGCPYEGHVPIERHIMLCGKYDEMGITDISLADTTGMANPYAIKEIVTTLREKFPHFHFSLHLHNTRGMAFANAVAGYEAGIRDFDSSIAGLGGCPYVPLATGNIATEDIIHGFEEMGIATNIDLDAVLALAREVQQKFPSYASSFLVKAGKNSELSISPGGQAK
ncbi:hydroxymethylglutaryl-CoA lyase [Lysinibacillus fusiformis]|nr:hydroxymethylglutaryl-CoA lyase [Lysinibacillus fusiformis]